MKILNWITFILVVIGGLNWGLIGIADLNIVSSIFGEGTLTGIIYDLVGLSAIYMLIFGGKMMAEKQ
ncbi:MAG: hypothetical protein UW11_C0029G0020 [Parcubacteria group bacterium GW2011_GWA2_43_9b]|uniref:DUF378 domain-containing protein n=1 Tax=Candidatus Portnoybacteria bacterium RIFCSPLOWO2_02_FULL_39_11 TaxID=1802001 RepID=A0A1G2FVF1_9BACT|nr:MAG: hypothetical protein UW11_C0029G0020 [Parcubacteria group bacterium GW2011_GWA2_43_9b]OGZ42049.1 MAG: DUF378 domain-containing protein [Candidatus Portnoybacteria bacterium RIFCSPLOWO2_02_FULL_39_11]